ncbi:MAG: flagellar hook capping FlgD N-terminal domain-containing protein, partial [Phenylobacterium sp.]|uniref:flagellar hook capping FlgD N-terminal domain-containing protein n=1 Tax=Phenylobacterium sp. TaxID=1871053 RepID=UPI002720E326
MAIDPTAGAGATPKAADTGRTRMADSYESFMSLLTAQIKNQDPLSPMDSTQFTQQLVQMT